MVLRGSRSRRLFPIHRRPALASFPGAAAAGADGLGQPAAAIRKPVDWRARVAQRPSCSAQPVQVPRSGSFSPMKDRVRRAVGDVVVADDAVEKENPVIVGVDRFFFVVMAGGVATGVPLMRGKPPMGTSCTAACSPPRPRSRGHKAAAFVEQVISVLLFDIGQICTIQWGDSRSVTFMIGPAASIVPGG